MIYTESKTKHEIRLFFLEKLYMKFPQTKKPPINGGFALERLYNSKKQYYPKTAKIGTYMDVSIFENHSSEYGRVIGVIGKS